MSDSQFCFNLTHSARLNLRQLDSLYAPTPALSSILPIFSDLSQIDISRDPELAPTPQSLHLHKLSQYTLQYLFHSSQGIINSNTFLKERLQILQTNQTETKNTIAQQEAKLRSLSESFRGLEGQNDHAKYLIKEEKSNYFDREKQVGILMDRLKREGDQ